MANRLERLRPPYPVYEPTPIFGGSLPIIDEIGPPDMRPSSSINPAYSIYKGAWGRNLAGLGRLQDEMYPGEIPSADEGIRDYPNELNVLAAADDVQGNGVFDAPGSHGNVHPDQGIFADRESLPGYIVRDRFYRPSQVIDGTTGEPVLFVPAGAVAIDQAQRDAIRMRQLLWELPPEVGPQAVTAPPQHETWIPPEYAFPISGLGQEEVPLEEERPSIGRSLFAFGIVGAAIGIFAATIMKR